MFWFIRSKWSWYFIFIYFIFIYFYFYFIYLKIGKSTIMSILAGALRATAGNQYVMGKNLIEDTSAIYRYVGVCPQFDVVWHDLSVAEHLSFQARQRGIPSERLYSEVQQAAIAVGLDGDGFYTKAGELSGGMRRRLSIAMSIVGNPPIIFTDGKFLQFLYLFINNLTSIYC